MTFILNSRLAADTHPIIDGDDYYLGLHHNALVPWLILVPKTDEVELFACEVDFRQRIRETVDSLAVFSQRYFDADKMNIATIGNVVSQLHIHIIARQEIDFAWPAPVWGQDAYESYEREPCEEIIHAVRQHLELSV